MGFDAVRYPFPSGFASVVRIVKCNSVNLNTDYSECLLAVLRIRMFSGLPDPDPLVRGMDPAPDPSLFP
jgi:hypothetical protein